jgi:3-oxoacyl-(acyl-carrier-protein) synthase
VTATLATAISTEVRAIAQAVVHMPCESAHAARLRSKIRYADPSSWLLVEAIDRAGFPGLVAGRSEHTAVVVVAPAGCPQAAADLARQSAAGQVSPIRYPAASPSASLGLCCIVFGLCGPTLTLTMRLADGVPRAVWLAQRYLARGDIDLAIVATVEPLIARCVVFAPPGGCDNGTSLDRAVPWLLEAQ